MAFSEGRERAERGREEESYLFIPVWRNLNRVLAFTTKKGKWVKKRVKRLKKSPKKGKRQKKGKQS